VYLPYFNETTEISRENVLVASMRTYVLNDSDLRIFFWTVKTGDSGCSEDTFQIFPGRTDKNHDQLQGRAKTFGCCVSV
jgi:hypothetical protein